MTYVRNASKLFRSLFVLVMILVYPLTIPQANEQPKNENAEEFIPFVLFGEPGIWMSESTARNVFVILDVYPQLKEELALLHTEIENRDLEIASLNEKLSEYKAKSKNRATMAIGGLVLGVLGVTLAVVMK